MPAFAINASAQVTVERVANGSYTTLIAAFNAINCGAQTGNASAISVTGDTTEPTGGAIVTGICEIHISRKAAKENKR